MQWQRSCYKQLVVWCVAAVLQVEIVWLIPWYEMLPWPNATAAEFNMLAKSMDATIRCPASRSDCTTVNKSHIC